MRGPARTSLEMAFAVSMTPCPKCGRHDIKRFDVHGEGTIWTLAGHCANCNQGRTESFRTVGDPTKTAHPMGEIGAGPTLMFTPEDLLAEIARIDRTLKADPRAVPREQWPAELASNSQAIDAVTELRKLIPAGSDELPRHLGTRASVDAIDARHIAILRAYEDERDRVEPSRPAPSGELTRDSIRAHESWLAKQRSGPGRLVVAHVDATDQRIGNVRLTAAKLDGVKLDRAGLAFVRLDEAELTDVTFVGANLDDATFTKATITGGSFRRARLAISRFDQVTITGSDFTECDLDRSEWKNARVTRANFTGVRFGNTTFDGATFTGCDFHQANLAKLLPSPLPTTAARFEDCDLRDTDWTGRSLDGAKFVRCKLAGAHGTPSSRARLVIEDCDLAADGFL